jgi:uncharacterized membrane protein YphA (DoxX/SURF4 family)
MASLSALREIALPYGPPLARVFLAAVFLYSGQDKLWHWQAGVKEVSELGLPWPHLFAGATIAVQLLGGLAVASGIGATVGAALLVVFTIVATALGHRFWLLRGDLARKELTTTFEHLAIVGGLLLIILDTLQES